jgi:two-component system CheB/CheR fusion protein
MPGRAARFPNRATPWPSPRRSFGHRTRTVNGELNRKIEALDEANSDLRNPFESTQIATIFLDRHLVIRNFTPAVSAIFNLIPGDIGRPLATSATARS